MLSFLLHFSQTIPWLLINDTNIIMCMIHSISNWRRSSKEKTIEKTELIEEWKVLFFSMS